MMGDAVPQTPGIYRFRFQNGCFLYCKHAVTIEMLDRNIGQRRDATRAPIQARNGWRPHGRRLGQPAAPSKDRRFFVQTTRTTSFFATQQKTIVPVGLTLETRLRYFICAKRGGAR